MSLWATKEVEWAENALAALATYDDATFVFEVRRIEAMFPEFRVLNCWVDGVRRELDMRLLIKGKTDASTL